MKFSTRQDVEVPAETLFDAVADFQRIEVTLVRRGARVRRIDPASGSPMAWDVVFDWRGRPRSMRLSVTRFDRPDGLEMRGDSDAFDMTVKATIVALSRARSRLLLEVEVKPRTMKARLLMQTARLTKGRLDAQFAERVRDYVASAAA